MYTGDVKTSTSNDQIGGSIATFEDLEVEFARATNEIKKALQNSHIDIKSLVEQLQTFSAVKNNKVQLLDEDELKNVDTVEKLWTKLSNLWSIFDYDLLRILLKLTECQKANKIFEKFLSRVDISVIKEEDLVLYYQVFERSKCIKPLLRIKVKVDYYTESIKAEVEAIMYSILNLEKYSLLFRGIREGCIELVYEISNAMMKYFLQRKFIASSLAELATHKIVSLRINNMELQIPTKIDKVINT